MTTREKGAAANGAPKPETNNPGHDYPSSDYKIKGRCYLHVTPTGNEQITKEPPAGKPSLKLIRQNSVARFELGGEHIRRYRIVDLTVTYLRDGMPVPPPGAGWAFDNQDSTSAWWRREFVEEVRS